VLRHEGHVAKGRNALTFVPKKVLKRMTQAGSHAFAVSGIHRQRTRLPSAAAVQRIMPAARLCAPRSTFGGNGRSRIHCKGVMGEGLMK
jgi:hypothetical protein